MRWPTRWVTMLPVWFCCSCASWAALNGFVETFSGDGPYDGLDNPDWFISGDSTFEDGGLRFTNHESQDEFGRILSGRGSFRATIEFGDLYLGDLDIHSSDDAVGIVKVFYDATPNDNTADAIAIALSENTGSPPDEWTLVVNVSGMDTAVATSVPQAKMTPVRLEFVYDDLHRELLFTYDHDTSDGMGALEFGPFPFDRNMDEAEQHINLLAGACCALTTQNGLLDYFGVEPFSNVPGDFNGNGILDAADIDQLSEQVRLNANDSLYDLNADALVNDLDRQVWAHDLKQTYFGDADLNGTFDSTDLVQVLASGEYEDGVELNSTWLTGDWDGDGEFTSGDLVVALADGGYEADPAAVPEPAGAVLMLLGVVLVLPALRHFPHSPAVVIWSPTCMVRPRSPKRTGSRLCSIGCYPSSMDTPAFRKWLQRQIRGLQTSDSEPDMVAFDDCAAVVAEAKRIASEGGHMDAYKVKCRSGPLSHSAAKVILAAMLKTLPTGSGGPLSVAQAAERLNVSTRHVYDLIAEGKLEALPGKPIRVSQEAIEAYLRPTLKSFKHL